MVSEAPAGYVMSAVLTVALVVARRRIARIEIHPDGQYQVFHGRDHDAHLCAPDKRIALEVSVNYSLQSGNVLAHEKQAQIVPYRHNKTV